MIAAIKVEKLKYVRHSFLAHDGFYCRAYDIATGILENVTIMNVKQNVFEETVIALSTDDLNVKLPTFRAFGHDV